MPLYQCYIVENDGTSAASIPFESRNNAEAHDYALRLLNAHPDARKVELWNGAQLTLCYMRAAAARSAVELRALCARVLDAAQHETDPGIKRTISTYALSLAEEAEALEWRARRTHTP